MENCTDDECISRTLRVLDAVILMAITVLGIVGNTLVCAAYILSRKLRTKTNIFVVNLAVADVLTCLCLPIVCWSLLIEVNTPIDPLLDILCGIDFGFIQIFVSCSIMTLALIAVNRYVLITKNKETYDWIYQNKFISTSICFSWTYPVLFVTLPLFFGVGHLGFDIEIHACSARTDDPHTYLYDIIVISKTTLPFALIIYSYGGIYIYLRQHNRHLQEGRVATMLFDLFTNRSKQSTGNSSKRGLSQNQVYITKNLFLILVSFFICLIPHIVCVLIKAHHLIILHTKLIVAFNSCINPILYGVKHPHFRRVFKSILSRRWSEIPDPAFKWMKTGPSTSVNLSRSRSREFESVSLAILASRC